jgi:hypothetical protein
VGETAHVDERARDGRRHRPPEFLEVRQVVMIRGSTASDSYERVIARVADMSVTVLSLLEKGTTDRGVLAQLIGRSNASRLSSSLSM